MLYLKGIEEREVKITEAYIVDDATALEIANAYSDDEADEKYQCYGFTENGVVMISDEGI